LVIPSLTCNRAAGIDYEKTVHAGNGIGRCHVVQASLEEEIVMGFGRGALLWLLGVPLPIVILLALFWHH